MLFRSAFPGHVLGAAIATASGKSLLALARERLGTPLGIEMPAWQRDPQGFYFGGNEMTLTPRAMKSGKPPTL